ncbi:MAG: alpha/beta fold hydrolase [Pontibacterium sp.]
METLIATDGTPIRYVSLGHGRPLIFLHGWTANAREWLPFGSALADQFRVFCWDARGHGDHSYPEMCDTHISTMAQDLQQLMDRYDLQDAILVGHSMGALTLWEYIRQFGTERLSAVCIIDQSPKLVTTENWQHGIYGNFTNSSNQKMLQRLSENFAEGVLELVAFGNNARSRDNFERNSRGFQQMREYLQQQRGDLLTPCWQSLAEQDYRTVLPNIDVPALLIYGDESQFYSTHLANWVAEQIPDSSLHIYENSDHSPQLWHKERFIYDLRKFATQLT